MLLRTHASIPIDHISFVILFSRFRGLEDGIDIILNMRSSNLAFALYRKHAQLTCCNGRATGDRALHYTLWEVPSLHFIADTLPLLDLAAIRNFKGI
jgi:hypothetical protein